MTISRSNPENPENPEARLECGLPGARPPWQTVAFQGEARRARRPRERVATGPAGLAAALFIFVLRHLLPSSNSGYAVQLCATRFLGCMAPV